MCAKEISPGRGIEPPPQRATWLIVWCGARNGPGGYDAGVLADEPGDAVNLGDLERPHRTTSPARSMGGYSSPSAHDGSGSNCWRLFPSIEMIATGT